MDYNVVRRNVYRESLNRIASKYFEREGVEKYLRFLNRAQQSIDFIASSPYACPVFATIRGKQFRRWHVKGFPATVFFSIRDPDTVWLEAVYAHITGFDGHFKDDLK